MWEPSPIVLFHPGHCTPFLLMRNVLQTFIFIQRPLLSKPVIYISSMRFACLIFLFITKVFFPNCA